MPASVLYRSECEKMYYHRYHCSTPRQPRTTQRSTDMRMMMREIPDAYENMKCKRKEHCETIRRILTDIHLQEERLREGQR